MVNIDDGYLNLMDDGGDIKDDLKVPEGDLGKSIEKRFKDEEQFFVTVTAAMGEEHVTGMKNATNQ